MLLFRKARIYLKRSLILENDVSARLFDVEKSCFCFLKTMTKAAQCKSPDMILASFSSGFHWDYYVLFILWRSSLHKILEQTCSE